MENNEELTVDGFVFGSRADADLARKEKEKIAYLDERLNYENPRSVLLVYNKTIDNRMLITPIGTCYLMKLQKYLIQNDILEEEIKKIPLFQVYSPNEDGNHIRTRIIKVKEKPEPLKFTMKFSVFINVMLLALVLLMFGMAINSPSPNIVNYEKALLNKYATWEEEIQSREERVREKEQELNIELP